MCGISAVYATSGPPLSREEVATQVRTSLNNIQHRGPDSSGIYVSPNARVALGHVRLAIIDLQTGQQPLSDEDNAIHCVVTGEIYDHERIRAELQALGSVFRTHSDSELVVHLYKHHNFNLLSSLRGEFAFVLYDSKRQIMFAARDRFGIKPLYYTVVDGRLLVASEMKALVPFGWKPTWDIGSIVQNGELTSDRTIFKGVQKLPAGHSLLYRPSGYLKTEVYWDIDYSSPDTPQTSTVDEMIFNVRSHIFEAIRLRLRSDVPLGIYLSGGIDSAAVAGMAAKVLREKDPNAKLATFTLAFRDAGNNDEGPVASRTAEFIGAEEHMVQVTEVDLVRVLEDAIWHAEHPINTFHASGKYLLSEFVREKGYKVVLSGEGADEFFGGYARLPVDYLRQPDTAGAALGLVLPSDSDRVTVLSRIQLSSVPVLSLSKNSYTDAQLGRKMLGGISAHRAYAASSTAPAEVYNPAALNEAGAPDATRAIAESTDPRVRNKAISGQWHSLNVASYVTAKTILQQIILNSMGERMEMAHSVEARPPILDHHLVEYVNTLPPSLKVRPVQRDGAGVWTFTDKWILREAVKPYVTEELFLRKKLSYNAPPSRRADGDSTLVPLQIHLKERITQENIERLGFLDWPYLKDLLTTYLADPVFPADGSLDTRAQILMYALSFLVLQERFDVPTWTP
ncbi:putative asparagine synthase [Mycena polygramma]|nr:putative asparagine synthase [Mycena polygramma]